MNYVVKLAGRTILWLLLLIFQLILISLASIAIAALFDTKTVPSPSLGWQLLPVVIGVPLGLASYKLGVFRSSGLWVWAPGVVGILSDVLQFGVAILRRSYFSVESLGLVITIITLTCALYSLTLFWLQCRNNPKG